MAGGREVEESGPAPISQSKWIAEEISTQVLHTTTESSHAQLNEQISKS